MNEPVNTKIRACTGGQFTSINFKPCRLRRSCFRFLRTGTASQAIGKKRNKSRALNSIMVKNLNLQVPPNSPNPVAWKWLHEEWNIFQHQSTSLSNRPFPLQRNTTSDGSDGSYSDNKSQCIHTTVGREFTLLAVDHVRMWNWRGTWKFPKHRLLLSVSWNSPVRSILIMPTIKQTKVETKANIGRVGSEDKNFTITEKFAASLILRWTAVNWSALPVCHCPKWEIDTADRDLWK